MAQHHEGVCIADNQGEESLAEMGLADSSRWAAHPVAMSADCGSAMARVRGAPNGAWPMKKPCVEDLRGGVALTDEQRQRIESMGTVRRPALVPADLRCIVSAGNAQP